jgi:hypothetical protein
MYSPKIDEALIPLIYRAAKAASVPMTTWVNQAVEGALVIGHTSQPLTVLDGAKASEPEALIASETQMPTRGSSSTR